MAGMPLTELLPAAAARWIDLWTTAALIGALILDLLVFPRTAPELLPARRRLRRWSTLCAGLLALGTAAELMLRARVMSGGGLATGLAAVPAVLLRTHFGSVWIARSIALGLVLLLSPVSARRARAVALVLAVGIALSTSLTGHAADWGDVSRSTFFDWLHLVAASAWTGGLIGLGLVALGGEPAWPSPLLATVAGRFSRLSGVCLLAVIGSGGYNAWVELGAVSALWTTAYGRVLAVKLAILVPLIAIGAINRYRVLPGLGARQPQGSGQLWSNIAREAFLATLIFACSAVLGESVPARHVLMPEPAHEGMSTSRTAGSAGIPAIPSRATRLP